MRERRAKIRRIACGLALLLFFLLLCYLWLRHDAGAQGYDFMAYP